MEEITENVVITLCDEEEIPDDVHLTAMIDIPNNPKECALNSITHCNNSLNDYSSYLCQPCTQKVIKTTEKYQQIMLTHQYQLVILHHPELEKPLPNVLVDYGNDMIISHDSHATKDFTPLPHECVICDSENNILFIPLGLEAFATNIT